MAGKRERVLQDWPPGTARAFTQPGESQQRRTRRAGARPGPRTFAGPRAVGYTLGSGVTYAGSRMISQGTLMGGGTGARRGYTTVPRTRGWAGLTSEMKYFDSERTSVAIGSTTDWTATEKDPVTLNTLFVPVKGTGINERIGRKVAVYKIKVRGLIIIAAQANQTAMDAQPLIRIALVQDTQTNAAQAQGEQIFQDPTTASANNAVLSFQSLDNLGRFNVLKDKFMALGDPNAAYDGTNIEVGGLVRKFQLFHEFRKPVEVHFNATDGGTVADIVDNSWHVITNANTTALAPSIVYQCRVSYKDL